MPHKSTQVQQSNEKKSSICLCGVSLLRTVNCVFAVRVVTTCEHRSSLASSAPPTPPAVYAAPYPWRRPPTAKVYRRNLGLYAAVHPKGCHRSREQQQQQTPFSSLPAFTAHVQHVHVQRTSKYISSLFASSPFPPRTSSACLRRALHLGDVLLHRFSLPTPSWVFVPPYTS